MPHIDLSLVLRRTVSARYDDLVTRRTGQAVRFGIERDLADVDHAEIAIIDFTYVRCLDFSCADEIIGKLLVEYGHVRYFLLRGVTESHQIAIEQILDRYNIAVVAQERSGRLMVLGPVPDPVRLAFDRVAANGALAHTELVAELDVPADTAEHAIAELVERKLAVHSPSDNRVVSLA